MAVSPGTPIWGGWKQEGHNPGHRALLCRDQSSLPMCRPDPVLNTHNTHTEQRQPIHPPSLQAGMVVRELWPRPQHHSHAPTLR